jgi:endonuclease/exonuclease/phosphatase family metal-dependent hydrolase
VAPGASFHAVRPVAKLDRVALGSGLALQGAGVVETGKARLASDHLPVWVDVTLAD